MTRSEGHRSGTTRTATVRTRRALLALAFLVPVVVSACADDDAGGPPTLTWYINPDNGGQAELATKCGDESDGAFRIETQILPNEADQQREQLVRRLAADDPSIDLMSLDPPFVAEFANAGYLLPITDPADVELFTDGVLEAPLETAFWDGQLVAPVFWANTQLLWYRKSVASAAGVDPTAADFTWQAMIEAAEAEGKRIGVQGRRYEGYMVWINALVRSGGGQIIENPELGADATPSVASDAGNIAAEIVGELGRSSAAPADMSTAGEEESRSVFQGDNGSFMVNWPYVYAAAQEAVAGGSLDQSVVDDIGWARYPAVEAGTPSAPAARRHQPRDRKLHQVSGRGPGGGEVHHVAREQHRVHDQVGQSGRPRRGLRRPCRTRGVPDGRPDPRVDQRRRRPARHPVLRRRLGVGATHVAPVGERRRTGHARRRPTSTWSRCSRGSVCCDDRRRTGADGRLATDRGGPQGGDDRAGAARATPRPQPVGSGVHRDDRRDRLPAALRGRVVALPIPTHRPRRAESSSASATTPPS